MQELVFDTLAYSKMLEKDGVSHADTHSAALATAILQNIYTKNEADKMIEAALKQFETRTYQIRDEVKEREKEFQKSIEKDRKEFQRSIQERRKEFQKSMEKRSKEFQESLQKMDERTNQIRLEMENISNKVVAKITINFGIIITVLTVIGAILHISIR